MPILEKTKLSCWFFLFFLVWTFAFMLLGIESGEGSQPTEDSSPILDTIYILASPFLLAFFYYYLYRRVNKWLVFLTAPFLGMVMEWLLFRPADVLTTETTGGATLFFAYIWALILIPPYILTRLADHSRRGLVLVLLFVFGFLTVGILRLVF